MNEQPTDLHRRLSHGIFINNVPVVPVVGVAYVILATLAAGAASPAAGFAVFVLGLLSGLVIYVAIIRQGESLPGRQDESEHPHRDESNPHRDESSPHRESQT